MLGLLLFKRAYSLASNNATLTTKATTFPSSSLVHYLPYKTFSKPTTQNQVLIKTNPFHHPLRPLISSQPSLAVAGKKLLILDYFRVWTFLRAQVNPKPGAKLHYTIGLPWNQWKSMFQQLKSSDMIKSLVMVNVAVLLMWWIADNKFMANNFTISVENFRNGRMHTLITSAFSHSDPGMLFRNMIGLVSFGLSLERTFGAIYVLRLYLAGAICGSLFHVVHHAFLALSSKEQGESDPSKTPAMGANGAVCAIMMLTILRSPKATVYIHLLFPVPAAVVGIFLITLDIWKTTQGRSHSSSGRCCSCGHRMVPH